MELQELRNRNLYGPADLLSKIRTQRFQIIAINHRMQGEILSFTSRAFKLVKDGLNKH